FSGEQNRIYRIYKAKNYKYQLKYALSGPVASIGNGKFVAGTQEHGLMLCYLEKGNLKYSNIVTGSDIGGASISCLSFTHDQLWIGSTNGFFKLELDSKSGH